MTTLKKWFAAATKQERKDLAERAGTSVQYLGHKEVV